MFFHDKTHFYVFQWAKVEPNWLKLTLILFLSNRKENAKNQLPTSKIKFTRFQFCHDKICSTFPNFSDFHNVSG